MSSLRALQKDLVPHRKFVRYLISPIRKLPPEILYQIFELKYAGTYRGSLDHHKFHLEIKGTSVDCPTLKLTWVCSYWRNLIIARPTLWNSMRLEVDYIERSSKMIDIFHYHILHSASVPLTLYLSGQYVSRLTPVHPVIDELLNNIGRWYRVHLALSGLPEDFSSFRDIPGGSIASVVPILEYMNIGTSALPMRLLSSCPNLRVFKASSISWRTFSRCDFRHLRTFQVGSINPSNIIMANFLRRMPQLKEFYMTNNYTNRSGLTAIPAQSLDPNPYCSTITILSVSLGCLWSGTWKNLLFPCLESFRCQTSHRVTSEHIASFSELASILARSDSRLEDVIFTNIPAKTAKDFLNYHPSISKFEYSGEFGATMYDEIFVLLTVLQRTDMSVVAIAPNLRTLFIDSTQYRLPVDHLLEDICSMALSRSVEPSHFGEEVHGIRVVQLKAMILGRNMENLINELQRRLASIRVSEV
ncbi:hypothetical protein GYMLUDRAFT_39215 [Collybiopsis luxurians FD-317 M1]|nr:hypothetical protein GYMLUDRAFT_39215 [Collybiopsis luxurians FD-317 M1]